MRGRRLINTFVLGMMLLASALFASLGVWQWQRAQEKQALLDRHLTLSQQAPKAITEKAPGTWQNHQRMTAVGAYDSARQLLIDNRHYQHQLGFEVLTPFHTEQGIVLVNRGWVPRGQTRAHLPQLPISDQARQISGQVYYPHHHLTIGRQWLEGEHWPYIIQTIDINKLQDYFEAPLYPFIIRLDPSAPEGFVRDWPITTMLPKQHIAYALQWFALSLTTLIILLVLRLKRS